jgi:hypothetical protein
MLFAHTQQPMGSNWFHGTFDLNELRLVQSRRAINQPGR